MMSYINETDFVIENKELVYPEIVTDGLQLYYDAKGKRDTDYHRDTMLDMSGNKNHGKLHNFAYEKHSGYKDGLVFDYIDDKLVRPALNLQPNDLTFMLNGNIISFSPDGTIKRVQDGEVIESKGFNLVRNGDFVLPNHPEWRQTNSLEYNINKHEITIIGKGSPTGTGGNWFALNTINPPNDNSIYYITALAKGQGQAYVGVSYNVANLYLNDSFRRISFFGSQIANVQHGGYAVLGGTLGDEVTFKEVIAINLTETFGAGNEPTKEQMDEIINRFGFIPNAQDLIDRIEYKGNDLGDMENIIDGLYKTEVLSGEEVYTDKADDAVVHVEVDGKSYQSETGENLSINGDFSNDLEDWMVNGSVTIDNVDGRKVTKLTGTNQGFYQYPSKQIPGFYEISFRAKSVGTSSSIRFGFLNAGTGAYTSKQTTNIWETYSFRTTAEVGERRELVHFYANVDSNQGVYITDISIRVIGQSPDNPIEIHSLNDFDVVSSVGKRNIVLDSSEPMNAHSQTNGLEPSLTPEGYYKVVASKGNGNWFYPKALYAMRFNGQIEKNFNVGDVFTFSVDIKSPDSTDVPSLYVAGSTNNGYTPLRGKMGTEFSRFYITSTWADLSSMNLALGLSSRSGTFIFRRMKIEKGSTPTPWTPAQEEIVESSNHPFIDKINLLLDEPLRSVGDVKDRLFRDSDGLWKVERNVRELVLDGSNTYTSSSPDYNSAYSTNRFITTDNVRGYATSNVEINSHAPHVDSVWRAHDSYGTSVNANQLHLRIPNSILGVIETDTYEQRHAKYLAYIRSEYLSETPITWLFQLATPSIETLSQPLQDKLNNLRSFEDSNYIYTVLPDGNNILSNNINPTLHAKFLYNNWYKEDRVINNLMIYNRALTNQEMLQNYKTIKRRWGM